MLPLPILFPPGITGNELLLQVSACCIMLLLTTRYPAGNYLIRTPRQHPFTQTMQAGMGTAGIIKPAERK